MLVEHDPRVSDYYGCAVYANVADQAEYVRLIH